MDGPPRGASRARRLAIAGTAALAAGVLVASSPSGAPAAGNRVPGDFFGVVVNNAPLLDSPSFLSTESRVMRGSGVQSIRIPVYWAAIQPDRGGPLQFGALDRLVQTAAQAHLSVLPTVLSSPPWAAQNPSQPVSSPPRDTADYATFMTTLVKRYGPRGAFWKAHPRLPQLPIHIWQIWNEPNLSLFWDADPYAPTYVALLRPAYAAVKRADPTAKVMLAGLPDRSWLALQDIYKAGGRRFFDIAAVHPYTYSPVGALHIVAIDRGVMARNHDANKPISLTETGWCTDRYGTTSQVTWNTSPKRQAANLTDLFSGLVRHRNQLHVQSVYWFNWYAPENRNTHMWEDFCGLRTLQRGKTASTPALAAYTKIARRYGR